MWSCTAPGSNPPLPLGLNVQALRAQVEGLLGLSGVRCEGCRGDGIVQGRSMVGDLKLTSGCEKGYMCNTPYAKTLLEIKK